jgi:hypothetical protein
VDFGNFSENPGADDFNTTAIIATGVNLDPHLGDSLVFFCKKSELPGLLDGVCQGFFAIDIKSCPKGSCCGWGMIMVGSAYDYCIEIPGIDHLPKIGEALCLGKCFSRSGKPLVVNIANPRDDFSFYSMKIAPASTPNSDDTDSEFLALFF